MNKTRILCYGDSNTWGYNAVTGQRFDDDERWTQLLAQELGSGFMVIEEGLSGRTTVFDDPVTEGLSGIAHLAPILGSHSALDLLVVMLGTNDCKQRFAATSQNIADGLRRLVKKAQACDVWRVSPLVLIVAPIIIDRKVYTVPRINQSMGEGCAEKSERLPELLKTTAIECGCHYLDANEVVSVNTIDYMHFDVQSNQKFSLLLSEKIRQIIDRKMEY
jgi:lysophospholipase L1-like esterase